MTRETLPADRRESERPARELDQQFEQLWQTAQTASFAEFHAALLPAIAATPPLDKSFSRAIVWTATSTSASEWEPTWVWPSEDLAALQSHPLRGEHLRKLQERLRAVPSALQPMTTPMGLGQVSLLLVIELERRPVAAIEIFLEAEPGSATRGLHPHVAEAFREVASEFYRRQQLGELHSTLAEERAAFQYGIALQRATSSTQIYYTAANEIARLVRSDRVAVLTRGKSWRVRAVSHVDSPDRRSPAVRGYERLATAMSLSDQPQWYPAVDHDAEHGDPAWQQYAEASPVRCSVFVPCLEVPAPDSTDDHRLRVLGGVIIERFNEQPFSRRDREQIERLQVQTAAAFTRTAAAEAKTFWGRLRRVSNLLIMTLGAAALGSLFLPVPFKISADGTLRASVRREIFAPTDGIVRQLHVADGDQVAEGEPLLELSNDELQFEQTRVAGELHTARQQLVTIQAARLDPTAATPLRESRGQLAAEEERLKQVVVNLEKQELLLQERRRRLEIHSPIAGRILTTDVARELTARPVRRGQRLLTVADEEQPWLIELWVRDQDAGHILAAHSGQEALPLEFALATEPTRTHRAILERVGQWTELHEGRPAVRLTARIVDADGLAVRSGATVLGKIDCGRRALGYVWFRDAWEMLRTRVLF